jgi:hypothetical protein
MERLTIALGQDTLFQVLDDAGHNMMTKTAINLYRSGPHRSFTMELSHETHWHATVSEPAVLDNSQYEGSLSVRPASPGPRPITGRVITRVKFRPGPEDPGPGGLAGPGDGPIVTVTVTRCQSP